jgi:hypothetical protein
VFRERALASDTPWDRYIRSITDDLPDHTATIASARFAQLDGFRGKWDRIASQLSEDECKHLTGWLIQEARKLAHEEFDVKVPDWMK